MANKKTSSATKKLRASSKSQGNYKKTVAENKQEFWQDVIDDRFTYATDYMQIEEEVGVGTNNFAPIGVRVTHGMNTSISDTFAKEFKKIIFQNYDHEQYLGKKYKFNNATWLTTDLNETTNASSHSFVRMCNNTLKWYSASDPLTLLEEPCVFTKQFTNTGFNEGKESVIQVSGDFMVLCQANARTKTIAYNQRFVFNGLSFQITQFDNHRSDTYLIFKLKQIDIQANDNVEDNIANDTNGIPTTSEVKILPQVIKILQGEYKDFTVYKYVDGNATSEVFSVVGSQAPEANYSIASLGGNEFRITNIAKSPLPLIVTCTSIESGDKATMSIVLGGIY